MFIEFNPLLLSILYLSRHFVSIIIFFIGDYTIYFIINYKILNNKLQKNYMTTKHWFFGNILSYTILSLLFWKDIGNTYYKLDNSMLYTLFTIPINIFLMDTFFYFMHRFAHIGFIYDNIHNLHHKYRPINSWISRISHWFDSNLENIAFTLPFVIVPTYFPLMWLILMFTFYWGCLIHDNKIDFKNKCINSPIAHAIHHKYGKNNYNFSYYFTFWDKLCGTHKN